MQTKYVFFDIDGTLWDGNMQIPDSTRQAIKKLRENGHRAFLCSGRSRANIRAKELWQLGFDGVIAACGNYIEMDGQVLYERLLSQELVQKSIRILEEEHMPVVLEGPKKHWVDPEAFVDDPYVDYLLEAMGEDALPIKGFKGVFEVDKFSADITKQTDYERVKRELGQELDFIEHDGVVVEFVPKGTSKATGIDKLRELLGLEMDQLYCVGDSANDMDMIEFVQHSIAMGNGTKELKEKAEFITTDIHEDGIWNALEHYSLI